MTDPHDPQEPPPDTTRGRRRFLDEAVETLFRLHRLVGEHAAWVSEADPRLGAVEQQVAALTGRVDVLADLDEDDDCPDETTVAAHGLARRPRGPVCWALLGPDEAAAVWEALATWLGEVVIPDTSPLAPSCPTAGRCTRRL